MTYKNDEFFEKKLTWYFKHRHTNWFDHFKQILYRVGFPKCLLFKIYPAMMNMLLPKIVFIFILAMVANLCFSSRLSSELDEDEILDSTEENFTRKAGISNLGVVDGSNLTDFPIYSTVNNVSLPKNGSVLVSRKNDDSNPIKKLNNTINVDEIIRSRLFVVFAIFAFLLMCLTGPKRNNTQNVETKPEEARRIKSSEKLQEERRDPPTAVSLNSENK
ncbi:hypothetical protein T4D_16659 [Trichinella pseudospiralis]|uniref:Uncharacterized protein n=1 Tax=Trichinella pseudospiralis TaxID=6337 RepID=A0A0V1FFK4_TRIPS|nr:hypothetical protein T4D_16659 [Trichinella pseudospiralis]